jgi:hypothetical protein
LATRRPLLVRWLALLVALLFASATFFHDGAHARQSHVAPDIAAAAAADLGLDDCDRDDDHAAKGEHCAAVTVCKICVPVAEMTGPRFGESIRHSWRGDSFTALSAAPHKKPPKLIVRP